MSAFAGQCITLRLKVINDDGALFGRVNKIRYGLQKCYYSNDCGLCMYIRQTVKLPLSYVLLVAGKWTRGAARNPFARIHELAPFFCVARACGVDLIRAQMA